MINEVINIPVSDFPETLVNMFKNRLSYDKNEVINNIDEFKVEYETFDSRHSWRVYIRLKEFNKPNLELTGEYGASIDIPFDVFKKSGYDKDVVTVLIRKAFEEYLCLKEQRSYLV